MPNRSIRWSLVSQLFFGCLVAPAVLALDDSPDIDLIDDPLASEFAQQFEQRLLPPETPYDPVEAGYTAITPEQIILPDPVVIPPGEPAKDETVVIAAAPPATRLESPPEWVLYQGNLSTSNPEEQLFQRINREYGVIADACTPGIDCPDAPMVLPDWPEQPDAEQAPFEIFDIDLITPFAPIPELNNLPFPSQG
ncbi:MAG: hypothetical protein HWE12_03705 [Oceanospirillaceae bacterium]|nr:hypothetical protein [Oceanospirillaceae bacterium]